MWYPPYERLGLRLTPSEKKYEFHIKSNIIESQYEYKEVSLNQFINELFSDADGLLPFQSVGEYNDYKYNALLTPLTKKCKTIIVHDDVNDVESFIKNKEYILAPCTFIGKNRKQENAREFYSVVLDLDNVSPENLIELFRLINNKEILSPSAIVNSGTGVHLYYFLDCPIKLFDTQKELLFKLTTGLIDSVWIPKVTTRRIDKKAMKGFSVNQGYRTIGSLTKFGEIAKGWINTEIEKYDIRTLNDFIVDSSKKLTREEINLLLYNDKNNNKKQRNWIVNRKFFDRVYNDLMNKKPIVGTRYYNLCGLVAVGVKCGLSYEEVESKVKDVYNKYLELSTVESFEVDVIQDALKFYNDESVLMRRDTLNYFTGLNYQACKRNGLTRSEHLELARKVERKERKKEILPRKKKSVNKVVLKEILKHSKAYYCGKKSKSEIAREVGCSVAYVSKSLFKPSTLETILRSLILNRMVLTQEDVANITKFSRKTISKYWSVIVKFMEHTVMLAKKEDMFISYRPYVTFEQFPPKFLHVYMGLFNKLMKEDEILFLESG